MIKAEVILDSITERGNRITTLELTIPRIVLAELNTHRMLTRNSASSRAIPAAKMRRTVKETPFIPLAWQEDHKGMQGNIYITEPRYIEFRNAQWLNALNNSLNSAEQLNGAIQGQKSFNESPVLLSRGITKQLCNRILEPFMYHKVLVTATEWTNFLALRCPRYIDDKGKVFSSRIDFSSNARFKGSLPSLDDDLGWVQMSESGAEIHIQKAAECIYDALVESKPQVIDNQNYHLPYVTEQDSKKLTIIKEEKGLNISLTDLCIQVSVARCARVSYTTIGELKSYNILKDLKLHDNLAGAGHWSPFEHQAKVMTKYEYASHIKGVSNGESFDSDAYGWSGNFKGFIQYRKTFKNENL